MDLSKSTVHLIHVFEIRNSNVEFTPIIYPTTAQYKDIEDSINGILSSMIEVLHLNANQVQVKCFFHHSKESCINSYLAKINADLVILATRGKHGIDGFFGSSLADFLCKYSSCDIFVLRPAQI